MKKEAILTRLRHLYHTNPFVHLLDIVIDDAGPGWAKSHMDVQPHLVNMDGLLHGGALGTLIDNLCGVSGRTLGYSVVTQNISASYIKNVPVGSTAYAACEVLHHGRSTMVMAVNAYSADRRLLCQAIATMFIAGADEKFQNIWEEADAP